VDGVSGLDQWETATPARAGNGTAPGTGDEVEPIPTLGFGDVATRRVEWLWRGRVAYGKVTLFDGQPGQSKSTVALDIAARVTGGRAMPDGAKPERQAGSVLIISAEDAIADTIGPRLVAAGAVMERVRFFTLHRDDDGNVVPLTIPDDLRRLKATVALHGVDLVVIDPLVAFLSERTDSHNDASVRRAMGPLTLFAEEAGVAVIGIRHLNKGVGLAAVDRGGGSVGIGGAARSVLIFAAHPDHESFPDLRVMASAKGNLAARPTTLGYRVHEEPVALDDGHVVGMPVLAWQREPVALTADQLVGFSADARKDAPERDAAAEWLREALADGPLPASELQEQAHAVGHSWRTVERAKPTVARSVRERNADGSTGRWVWLLHDDHEPEGTGE
jgi:RecA-family ATPase